MAGRIGEGNHDHYGNISAQVAYSEHNPRWVFPSYYYTWTKPVDSRTSIQFVYIDTVLLSGNSDVHHPTTHELLYELRAPLSTDQHFRFVRPSNSHSLQILSFKWYTRDRWFQRFVVHGGPETRFRAQAASPTMAEFAATLFRNGSIEYHYLDVHGVNLA